MVGSAISDDPLCVNNFGLESDSGWPLSDINDEAEVKSITCGPKSDLDEHLFLLRFPCLTAERLQSLGSG